MVFRALSAAIESDCANHLGSGTVGLTVNQVVIGRESFTPFGEPIINSPLGYDQPGFTGHIRDRATGLTYAQARYYNPVTARFLAPDPVGFASGGPGFFNRYAYAFNDPVNHTDPDGECAGPIAIPCAVGAGAAVRCAGSGPCRAAVRAGAGAVARCAGNSGCRQAVMRAGAAGSTIGVAVAIAASGGNDDPYTTPGGREVAHGPDSEDYIGEKGWTAGEIDDVLDNPADSHDNRRPNHRSGERQRTYYDQDGNWVVVDESGRVTQVNEKGNDRQPPPEPEPEPEEGP